MRSAAFAVLVVATFVPMVAVPAMAQNFAAGKAAYDSNDYATAFVELQPLAKTGHAEAQFLLAMIHGNGFGVRQDRDQAAYWYRQAAEQGHDVAQLHLGFYYLRGYGVPQDHVFSLMWTGIAAELGNVEAHEWREKVASEMTDNEIADANARAADWLFRHQKLH